MKPHPSERRRCLENIHPLRGTEAKSKKPLWREGSIVGEKHCWKECVKQLPFYTLFPLYDFQTTYIHMVSYFLGVWTSLTE